MRGRERGTAGAEREGMRERQIVQQIGRHEGGAGAGEMGRRKTSANLASGCGGIASKINKRGKKTILMEADFFDSFQFTE